MNIPSTINPTLNLNDQSAVDESVRQDGVTINASGNATINSNSGNGRVGLSRMSAMVTTILFSIFCDFLLGAVLWNGQVKMAERLTKSSEDSNARFERQMEMSSKQFNEAMDNSRKVHAEMMKQAKEDSIWILRHDIIGSIDYHEATKTITKAQYRRLKDEFDHYVKIGGNHDVKERFDDFTAKIYGTGEVKMVTMMEGQK